MCRPASDAPGAENACSESMRINCGKREWVNWANSAPRTETCQVQSLVMRVLTLVEMLQANLRNAEKSAVLRCGSPCHFGDCVWITGNPEVIPVGWKTRFPWR